MFPGQSDDEKHKIDPIRFSSTPAEALNRLKEVLGRMERTTLVQETPNYLHVEYRTFLGFVDGAEFYLDAEKMVIHVRSTSRVGYWDLGVNRRRMESIRADFGRN